MGALQHGRYRFLPLHCPFPRASRTERLAVCACVHTQVATFAVFHGEVTGMVGQWREILTGWAPHVIALTGFVSFVLTVLSMHATKFATPLTVSVMGAFKQASGRWSMLQININLLLNPHPFLAPF